MLKLKLHRLNNLSFDVPEGFPFKEFFKIGKEKHGDNYQVTIQYAYKIRSTGPKSQNHNLNGGIQQICEETGNDFADVKMYIKKKALRRGYPIMKDKNGNDRYSMIDGEPIPESETKASTHECGFLIDEMQVLAAELEIVLKV